LKVLPRISHGNYYWILIVYSVMSKILFIHCLLCVYLLQTSVCLSQSPSFEFGGKECTVVDVKFYDSKPLDNIARGDERFLIISSFGTDDYEEYTSYFLPGECHVSKETFYGWKSTFGQSTPELKASYTLIVDKKTICVVQYTLEYRGNCFLGPFIQKKVGDNWYLMKAENVGELIDVATFFSLVKEGFVADVLSGNVDDKSRYYSPGIIESAKVDASALLTAYLRKYDKQDEQYELLNNVFQNRVQYLANSAMYQNRNSGLQKFIDKSELSSREKDYLYGLIEANLFSDAVMRLAGLTNKAESEILNEINVQIKKAEN